MRAIAVMGLGYVGLGLAVELAKKNKVIGYDISKNRISELKKHHDKNTLLTEKELADSSLQFTDQLNDIKAANFYIVTVSTPAYYYSMPDLEPLVNATKELATILKKGDIVVFESTVYPGTTEEVCVPLLEEGSHLRCGEDFSVGYSPERINPGDKIHTLKEVTKVISALDEKTLAEVKKVYASCCDNVYPVSNMKTAEAVKILENTQRDINIAIMNEFAEIMHAMDISVYEVRQAAKTKWSFVDFKPGLVGGHCISVDPLYLAFKAKRLGVNHDLILSARKINDNITRFIVQELSKLMISTQSNLVASKVGVLGITYKENVPDVRNSLALKLVKELMIAGFTCEVNDPFADKAFVKKRYDIDLVDFEQLKDLSVVILVVPHNVYKDFGFAKLTAQLKDKRIFMDIPSLFVDEMHNKNIIYWGL